MSQQRFQSEQQPKRTRGATLWGSIALVVITALAVLLALLAPLAAAGPPSTAGLQPLYQSRLTSNDGAWKETSACQFSQDGLTITAKDANTASFCELSTGVPHDLLMTVRLAQTDQIAAASIFSDLVLEIFGTGRFQVSRLESSGQEFPLIPLGSVGSRPVGAGSIALHPSSLGTSTRPNDLVILVQGNSYSFYANGQLLTRYTASTFENAAPIRLYALGGQAIFTDLAVYPAP
jgi:hypothetical protein